MPRIQHINRAFTFGYISKNMFGRAGEDAYEEGLAECINFTPKPQGTIERRQGREHIVSLTATDGVSIPFITRSNNSFMAVFTDEPSAIGPGLNTLRIIDKRGVYKSPASPAQEIIENQNLEKGLVEFQLTETNNLPDGGEEVVIDYIKAFGSMIFKSTNINSFGKLRTRSYINIIDIPPGTENDVFGVNILFEENPTNTRVKVGSTPGGIELGNYIKNGSGRLSFNLLPVGADKVYLEFTVAIDIPSPSNGAYHVSKIDYLSVVNAAQPGGVEILGHPYKKGEFKHIQHDFEPEGNAIWLVHENHEPARLTLNDVTGEFTLQSVVTDGLITDPPTDWELGNYPGSIVFHQGRLWFAGTRLNPATLYASSSDNYLDFKEPQKKITADSPLHLTLSRFGSISWMTANKELIVGTSSGEFRITAGGDGLVTTDSVVAVLESTYGSIRSQPVLVANRIVFATEDGKRLRDLGYNDSESSWVSIDLTLIADDITLNRNIESIEYSQNPDHLIRCLMDDGSVIVCAYRKSLKTIGWYEEITDGDVVDIASTLVNGNSETIFLVRRGDQDQLSVEWEVPHDDIFLDNYKTQFSSEPTNDVFFPHLAGRFISVFADNAVQPDIKLDVLGRGVIQNKAFNITAGLKYISLAKTLPVDSITRSSNTTMGFMKRFNKIWAKINRSANPKINGERPPSRTPTTPMDIGEPVRFKDVQVANMGWDEFGQITIVQDLPYACIVSAIYGEVSEDQL